MFNLDTVCHLLRAPPLIQQKMRELLVVHNPRVIFLNLIGKYNIFPGVETEFDWLIQTNSVQAINQFCGTI